MSLRVKIKLTHKITAIGILGVVGVILVGGMHMYGETEMTPYREAAEKARAISALNDKIEIELLQARRAEKDFLLRNDQKKIGAHAEIGKVAVSDIGALHEKLRVLGKDDLVRKVEAIGNSLRKYQAHFTAVASEKVLLGLDEKSGLEGRLRGSVHDIEARVDELHQPSLVVTILMMRRHEKDFILRRDAKYGEEMRRRAFEFDTEIDGAEISEATKTELKKKLTDYQRDFFAWFDTALKLAAESKAMSESFAEIEPVIEAVSKAVSDIRTEAEQSNAKIRDDISSKLKIVILLVAFTVLGIGFFIRKSISKPLSALRAAMAELAGGNFAIVLPGLGRADEIGEISQAVETFKINAEQKARNEAAAKAHREQEAMLLRKADMVRLADDFEAAVGEIIETVSSASTELEASAGALNSTA